MRRFSRSLSCAAILVVLFASSPARCQTAEVDHVWRIEEPLDAHHAWALNNSEAILALLFPYDQWEMAGAMKGVYWRAADTFAERRLVFERLAAKKVRLVRTSLENGPLELQLAAIHRNAPDTTPAAAAGMIRTRERVVSQEECPALLNLAKEFEALRLRPLRGPDIILHGVEHDVYLQKGVGFRMRMHLYSSDDAYSKSHPESEPLAQFFLKVEHTVDRSCGGWEKR